jgi:hypothetical protein
MEKKEFPKIKDFPPIKDKVKPKISGFSQKIFGTIKLILGICLLPFVYSASVFFIKELQFIDRGLQAYFWAGIISFLILHLFIWEPVVIYRKGYRLLEIVFSFFAPLVRFAPYVVPIYTILIFVAYLLLSLILKSKGFFNLFLLLFSFSFALHLVFSAKSVKSKQGDFLKANYLFGFSFIYIFNVLLIALCLSVVFQGFSFINFFDHSFREAKGIFFAVFRQLFL